MARRRTRSMDPKALTAEVERILAITDPLAAEHAATQLLLDVVAATAPAKIARVIEPLHDRPEPTPPLALVS